MTSYQDVLLESVRVGRARREIAQKIMPYRYMRMGVTGPMGLEGLIVAESDWRNRMDHFRALYAVLNAWADADLFDYMRACPHDIMDFEKIMTPIEIQFWHEARAMLTGVWPQYPVGRFIADFAMPVLKIAVECDGRAYHDPARDEARDAEMARMGWTVYRVTGSQCNNFMAEPERRDHEDDEEYSARHRRWAQMTLGEAVGQIRARFDDYRMRNRQDEEDEE